MIPEEEIGEERSFNGPIREFTDFGMRRGPSLLTRAGRIRLAEQGIVTAEAIAEVERQLWAR